jgi:hypothetical protein
MMAFWCGPRRSTLLTMAMVALWTALPAEAQEGPRPTLGGHLFVSTDLIPDAFVRTYVRNSIGYSQAADFDYPPVVVRGDTLLALDGSLAYATLGMEYQHAIRDWIAVRLGVGMRTRLGTQLSSILSEGVNVTSGLEFGWLARLRQTPRTMLCGSLAVSSQNLTVIDVRQFTEDVIDGVADPSLIDDVPAVRSTAGLRFAWAASRPVGVTLLLEGSYGETPRRDEAESWEYGMGASVDFDAGAAWDVPIGIALAYRQTSLPVVTTTDNGNVSETVLRLAYNGKRDFLIAIDVMGVLDRENLEADPVWAGGAAFSLRYYF